ncbi:hypothetical protein [Aminipila sp.]|uniref:hypothetical protein n=1 Tax=Aminipila sp. TaxID=2060095 RepID=UPI0028A2865C|nr:hypothetical protein [Aminipila sp.]
MLRYIIKTDDSLIVFDKQFELPLVHLIKSNSTILNQDSIYLGKIIRILQLPSVPSEIDVINSKAKAIIENIYAGDWESATDNLNLIKANMNELIPKLHEASVLDAIIVRMNLEIGYLDQNINKKNTEKAIDQANRITLYIADILDYFNVIVPTDVNRMGFFGREILIQAQNNQWDDANINYLQFQKIWEGLKPQLDPKFNEDINDFNETVNDLGESIKSKDYQATVDDSNILLDKLDIYEADFRRRNTQPIAPPAIPPSARPTPPPNIQYITQ